MKMYKQELEKRKISFFSLAGLFSIFFILLFSISNVYGLDSEIILSDSEIFTSDNDTDYADISLVDDSVESISFRATTSELLFTDVPVNDSTYEDHIDNISKNNKLSYITDSGDNLIVENSIYLNSFDSGNYFIFDFHDPSSEDYYNHIKDSINHEILLSVSLNFKRSGFENFNNIIRKIDFINFNKIDNDENISIIQDPQSGFNPTVTILFFMKIFLNYHNNGKHLSPF